MSIYLVFDTITIKFFSLKPKSGFFVKVKGYNIINMDFTPLT